MSTAIIERVGRNTFIIGKNLYSHENFVKIQNEARKELGDSNFNFLA